MALFGGRVAFAWKEVGGRAMALFGGALLCGCGLAGFRAAMIGEKEICR